MTELHLVRDLTWRAQHHWWTLPDWVRLHYEKGRIMFGNGYMHLLVKGTLSTAFEVLRPDHYVMLGPDGLPRKVIVK